MILAIFRRALLASFLVLCAPVALRAAVQPRWLEAVSAGIVPDGRALNTVAINRAIELLSREGGGTLHFGPGSYLTGTVNLLSGVTLHLEAGATLLGSTEIGDYPENQPPRPTDRLEYGRHAIVSCVGQHDVAIVGSGRINGQGDHPNFTKKDLLAKGWTPRDAYLKRPYGLSFIGCQRVRVENIRLQNIAFWCQHYLDCDDVVVRGLSVDSKKSDYNNDGIDIDGSRNVRVSDCHFSVGDDAICLKAAYKDCENVVVTNCTASSLANGVKFGTASNAGFKNIAISNIVLDQVQAAGIALEIVDGGTLDGVSLSNFSMRSVGTALFIRLGDVGRRWTKGIDKPRVGILRNVSIDNIVADLWSEDARPLCGSITGLPGFFVENVSLSNLNITSRHSHAKGVGNMALDKIPELANAYPEYSMFGPLPAYGFYIRHVRGLTLSNVQLGFTGEDYRSAIVCDDVENLTIDGLQARALADSAAVMVFNNVRGASVTDAVLWNAPPVFLELRGESSGVYLGGDNLPPGVMPLLQAKK